MFPVTSKRVALEFVSDCSVSILVDSNESIWIQVKESATTATEPGSARR